MLLLLATRTIKKMRYSYNEDKLDCYQSGLLDMFDNWYNFSEEKLINALNNKTSNTITPWAVKEVVEFIGYINSNNFGTTRTKVERHFETLNA